MGFTAGEFTNLGVQYYAAARWAATARLIPVCGSLFHHAVEMFLKAVLAKTRRLDELKKLGHDLEKLWGQFKQDHPAEDFVEFDDIIFRLNKFERIRYPDHVLAEGMMSSVGWDRTASSIVLDENRDPLPRYDIVVTEIDNLVMRIIRLSQVRAYVYRWQLGDPGRQMLKEDNRFAAEWLEPHETQPQS